MTRGREDRTIGDELRDLEWFDQEIVLDTSETDRAYVVRTKSGQCVRLSSSAFHLLREVKRHRSFEELARVAYFEGGKEVTPADVERAYERIAEKLRAAELNAGAARGAFWLRLPLIPARAVAKVSSLLTWAHRPPSLVAAVLLAAVVAVSYWWFSQSRHHTEGNELNIFYAYGLYFLSLLAHEFGHSSACARYGARPSDIGLGVYFVFPVLYSDVSEAWALPRFQRAVVDVGGVYFQLVVGVVYLVLFMATLWLPLYYALSGIFGTVLLSMNPIFRFDGYWVMTDLMGVANLGQQRGRVLGHYWDRIRRRQPARLPWPRWLVVVIALYSLVSFGVITVFIVGILPGLVKRIASYPGLLHDAFSSWIASGNSPGPTQIESLIAATFAVVLGCLMCWQIGRRLVAASARIVRTVISERRAPQDSLRAHGRTDGGP